MAPSVLVFARTWSVDALAADLGQGIARRMCGLGAELVVLGAGGVWSLAPEDGEAGEAGALRHTDRLAGDVATAATLYQARDQGDAVFVIEEHEVVRVGCDAHDLVSALDAATAWLAERRTGARHEAGPATEARSPAQPLIDPRSRP